MRSALDLRLDALQHRLPPRAPGGAHAAVSVALRPGAADLEVLLILRAERSGDPWSGHVALPGGRRDPQDADDLATAIRETSEEVGISLETEGKLLGGLEPVEPRSNAGGMLVAPWVFAVPAGTRARPNAEVQASVWVPLAEFSARDAAWEHVYQLPTGLHLAFPAFRVQGLVVWGMTYRILVDLLERGAI